MTAPRNIIVAPATEEDLPHIANINVTAWRESYTGIIPQNVLDALDPAERAERWKTKTAEQKDDPRFALFFARVDGMPAGYISIGPARDTGFGATLEIYAAYVLNAFKNIGVGHVLFQQACKTIHDMGTSQTYLWVLEENTPAIKAYTRWGGKTQSEHIKYFVVGDMKLKEILVTFDLSAASIQNDK